MTYLSTRRTVRSFDEPSRKTAGVQAGDTGHSSMSRVAFLALQTLNNPATFTSTFIVGLLYYSSQC